MTGRPPLKKSPSCLSLSTHNHKTSRHSLCYDTVAAILDRLPQRSFTRLKLTSKEWLAVADRHLPLKAAASTLLGFFIVDPNELVLSLDEFHCGFQPLAIPPAAVDTTLAFLRPLRDVFIVDSCNGLLLCAASTAGSARAGVHFVCNPATRNYAAIPCPPSYRFRALVYDPDVSPHFKIIWIHLNSNSAMLYVYSSQKQDSEGPRVSVLGGIFSVYSSVIWNGAVYLRERSPESCDRNRLTRFDLSSRECSAVALPHHLRDRKARFFFGRLAGKVGLGAFYGFYLLVWVLKEECGEGEWVVKHSAIVKGLKEKFGWLPKGSFKPRVLAFHIYSEVAFILTVSGVFAYDLRRMELEYVCKLASDRCDVAGAGALPYSPCFMDGLKSKQEQKPA